MMATVGAVQCCHGTHGLWTMGGNVEAVPMCHLCRKDVEEEPNQRKTELQNLLLGERLEMEGRGEKFIFIHLSFP